MLEELLEELQRLIDDWGTADAGLNPWAAGDEPDAWTRADVKKECSSELLEVVRRHSHA